MKVHIKYKTKNGNLRYAVKDLVCGCDSVFPILELGYRFPEECYEPCKRCGYYQAVYLPAAAKDYVPRLTRPSEVNK